MRLILSLMMLLVCTPLSAEVSSLSQRTEKIPYKAQWVSRVKKRKLFLYKRKEFSSPRIYEDTIFTGSDAGVFYAMRKKNGNKIWRFKATGSINSTPGFLKNTEGTWVLFGDDKGIFYALDTKKGKEVWRSDLGSEILTAPAVFEDKIYVATVEGRVVALNASDGHPLWDKENPVPGFTMTIRGNSPPVLTESGKTLFVGFADGKLWALSTSDGKLIWKKDFGKKKGFSDIDATPLIEGDRLYIATFDGGFYALSTKSGEILWSQEIGSGVRFAAREDVLYVSGEGGRLYAFQKKDGKKIWDKKLGKGTLTAPVIYKNIIVVGLSETTINFLHADTGKLIAHRFAIKGISSNPMVDENRIYYLSNGGRLYSLKFIP